MINKFRAEVDDKGHLKIITDGETVLNNSYEVVDVLNEQQAEIDYLKDLITAMKLDIRNAMKMVSRWNDE